LPEDWAILIDLTAVSPSTSGLQEPDLRSQPVNGITLRLLKVSQEPDQTAFQLGLEWDGQNRIPHHMPAITLQDDQGRTYTQTSGPEGDQFSPDHPNSMTFSSLVTDAVDRSIRLTFRLDWVVMSARFHGLHS
jgi:hypothetical protein